MEIFRDNEMSVRCWGDRAESDRIDLLYVHGLGESGRCFESIAAHPGLADLTQFCPDLPGYGLSSHPAEPLSLTALADRLAAWLEQHGAPPVTVVGHSMGGVVAVDLAERYPERVAAVIDVDGNVARPDCSFSGLAAGFDVAPFVAGGFAAMIDRVERDGRDDPALRGYAESLRLCDPRAYHRNSRELLAASLREDQALRLAALPMPARYIAGAPGGASPRSRELLERAGVTIAVVAPSGHWPFIDQPDQFVAALRAGLPEPVRSAR